MPTGYADPAIRPAVATASSTNWTEGASAPLRVNPITGALKTEVTGAGAGGTSSVDGDAFTAGTSAGTPMMAENGTTLKIPVLNSSRDLIVQLARGSDGAEIATLGTPLRNQQVGTADANVAQINGVTPLMGAGNTGTGSPRVTIATDQATIPVADQAITTGGLTIYSFLSTAAVQAAAIKASAGQVYALHFFNNTATICYVRLYNQTASPANTDSPVYRMGIPANTSGAGFVVPIPPGVAFGTGIGIRVTAAIADNDTTALAANAILGNVFYK